MTAAELADSLRWVAWALCEAMEKPTRAKVHRAYRLAASARARHIADEWNAAHPVGTVVEFWYGDSYGACRKKTTGPAAERYGMAVVEVDGREMPVEELTAVAP